MTPQTFSKIFWKQYLLLEKDFLETDEFVTIDKSNFKTFSSRYTYLFLNICSEIDSIAEEYCKVVKAPSKVKNILQKMTVIVNDDPKIKDQRVSTKYPYEIINFVPFAGFDSESAAGWWQDYNLVKHFRADVPEKGIPNYQRAHLKNVMTPSPPSTSSARISTNSLSNPTCNWNRQGCLNNGTVIALQKLSDRLNDRITIGLMIG